jgi:predicted transcriptional regulator
MSERLRSITIRVPPALWDRVERLAAADRRPASQLIRNLIEDAVAARPADVTGAPLHA